MLSSFAHVSPLNHGGARSGRVVTEMRSEATYTTTVAPGEQTLCVTPSRPHHQPVFTMLTVRTAKEEVEESPFLVEIWSEVKKPAVNWKAPKTRSSLQSSWVAQMGSEEVGGGCSCPWDRIYEPGVCVCARVLSHFSRVWLFVTLWTVAH